MSSFHLLKHFVVKILSRLKYRKLLFEVSIFLLFLFFLIGSSLDHIQEMKLK